MKRRPVKRLVKLVDVAPVLYELLYEGEIAVLDRNVQRLPVLPVVYHRPNARGCRIRMVSFVAEVAGGVCAGLLGRCSEFSLAGRDDNPPLPARAARRIFRRISDRFPFDGAGRELPDMASPDGRTVANTLFVVFLRSATWR